MNTWCEDKEHLVRGSGTFGAEFGNIDAKFRNTGANDWNICGSRSSGAEFGNSFVY